MFPHPPLTLYIIYVLSDPQRISMASPGVIPPDTLALAWFVYSAFVPAPQPKQTRPCSPVISPAPTPQHLPTYLHTLYTLSHQRPPRGVVRNEGGLKLGLLGFT